MKYHLDDRPSVGPLLLYGLQWWVVSLPCIVIMGMVVARLHFTDPSLQAWYLQKLFVVMGLGSIVQVLWGHKLPLIAGPASTLLIGIIATHSSGISATYSAIVLGGLVLAIAGSSGLLSHLRFFFTPRIVAVILVLIALTLSPTILNMIVSGKEHGAFHLCFAVVTVFALILCNTILRGVWKSLTVIIGMVGGSLVYFLFTGFPELSIPSGTAEGLPLLIEGFDVQVGTLLAFLFCFLALTINELGSIESIGQMIQADAMEGRIKRGTALQGVNNMIAGGVGVIGSVDFSMSAGIIAATGCASRFTLIPAGIGIALCGLFPQVIAVLLCIPGPVMGALMLYLMASQLAGGLEMLVKAKSIIDFNSGVIVGFPLMVSLIISFAPAWAFEDFPALFKPIIGNGFVMGAIAVIVLEHVVFRKSA